MKQVPSCRLYLLNIPWAFLLCISFASILLSTAYSTGLSDYISLTDSEDTQSILIREAPDGDILPRLVCILPVLWSVLTRTIMYSRTKKALIYLQIRYRTMRRWFFSRLFSGIVFDGLYSAVYFMILFLIANAFAKTAIIHLYPEVCKIIALTISRTGCLFSIMSVIELHFKWSESCIISVLCIITWIALNTFIYCMPFLGEMLLLLSICFVFLLYQFIVLGRYK